MSPLKFIPIARAVASLSKDPSTKVGAVIVADDGTVLCMGYNGFPRGVIDSEPRYQDKQTKYKLVSHAESNAIAQAARHGIRVEGSTLIVTALYPCSSCAKQIIQAGIKQVFYPHVHNPNPLWAEEWKISQLMFNEAGIKLEEYL